MEVELTETQLLVVEHTRVCLCGCHTNPMLWRGCCEESHRESGDPIRVPTLLGLWDNLHDVGPSCLPGCKGYVPVTDLAALFRAVREQRWALEVLTHPDMDGDYIRILGWRGGIYKIIGTVADSEGLWFTEAFWTAVLRALVARPDNDPEWQRKAVTLLGIAALDAGDCVMLDAVEEKLNDRQD